MRNRRLVELQDEINKLKRELNRNHRVNAIQSKFLDRQRAGLKQTTTEWEKKYNEEKKALTDTLEELNQKQKRDFEELTRLREVRVLVWRR